MSEQTTHVGIGLHPAADSLNLAERLRNSLQSL